MALSPADLKKIVQDGMNGILFEHSEEKTREYFSEEFIQHNPFSADGLEHLLAMTNFTFVYEPARWIIDGDIVAYHGMYTSTNPLDPEKPLHCIDMWRVGEDGKVNEHWDALEIRPFGELAGMLAGEGDGLKQVEASTVESNKKTAEKFVVEFFNDGHTHSRCHFLAKDFVMHTEKGAKGSEIMVEFLKGLGGKLPLDVKRVIGSGDLVLVHSRFNHEEMKKAAFQIFRFDNHGKIAEMWTVSQDIAEETDNPHPHF